MDLTDLERIKNQLKYEWVNILTPWWRSLVVLSSVSDLDSFTNYLSQMGISPSDVLSLTPLELSSKTKLQLGDSAVVIISMQLHLKENTYKTVDSPGCNSLHQKSEKGTEDIVFNYKNLDLFSPSMGQASLYDVNDLYFAERALVSVKNRKINFHETLLCTAGPTETIGSEQNIHSILTIPEAILLSSSFDAFSEKNIPVHQTYNFVYFILINIIFIFSNMAFCMSLLHITICSFAKLTDRTSARYLSSNIYVRLMDVILVTIAITLKPLTTVFYYLSFSESKNFYEKLKIYTISSFGIIFTFLILMFTFIFIIRERNSFKELPKYLKFENPLYSITNSVTNIEHTSGKSKTLKRIFRKFLMIDYNKEVKYLSFIGRWRKYLISKRFNESVYDVVANTAATPINNNTSAEYYCFNRSPNLDKPVPNLRIRNSAVLGHLGEGRQTCDTI